MSTIGWPITQRMPATNWLPTGSVEVRLGSERGSWNKKAAVVPDTALPITKTAAAPSCSTRAPTSVEERMPLRAMVMGFSVMALSTARRPINWVAQDSGAGMMREKRKPSTREWNANS
jgi:hypothetical protein